MYDNMTMIGTLSQSHRACIATVTFRDRTGYNGTESSIDTVSRKSKESESTAYVVPLHRAAGTDRRGKIVEAVVVRDGSLVAESWILDVVLGEAREEN